MKSSIFTGVSFEPRSQKWVAQLWVNGRIRNLGRYDGEEEAALAVDNVKIFLHQYFTKPLANQKLNFPRDETQELEILYSTLTLERILIAEEAPVYSLLPGAITQSPEMKMAILLRQLRGKLREITVFRDELSAVIRSFETEMRPPQPNLPPPVAPATPQQWPYPGGASSRRKVAFRPRVEDPNPPQTEPPAPPAPPSSEAPSRIEDPGPE